MLAIHAPPRKKQMHQHGMPGIGANVGRLSRELSQLGKLAAIPRAGERMAEQPLDKEEPLKRWPEELDRIDLKTADGVEQMFMLGLQRQNKEMIRKALLSVIRWKNPGKAREFFRKFFENDENEQMKEIGRKAYADYLRLRGEKLW